MVIKNRLLLAPVVLLVLYYFVRKISLPLARRKVSKKHGCRPAYRLPQPERIIGYGLLKQSMTAVENKNLLEMMSSRFQTHGNTFTGVLMGQSFIQTIEPEYVKSVLSTNFGDYGIRGRKESFGPLLGDGIFTSDWKAWEHSRALIRPSFVKAQVSDLNLYEIHVQRLIALIPRDGSTIDLQPLFFRFTLDSATEYLFGKSVNSLQSPHGPEKEFTNAIDYAFNQIVKRYRLGIFSRFVRDKKFSQACKTAHKYVDGFVHTALLGKEKELEEKENRKYTLLHEPAKATQDPIQLRYELLNILAAGRDTTASLLSNTFFAIARRPDIWAKLRAEVDTLGGEKPDYDSLRQMKYVKHVLNEALRLFPVVPANSRFALRDTILPCGGGFDGTSPVFVAKGTIMAWSILDMQRRKDIYGPDADEFNPDRWATLRPGWGYLPFNGGTRVCIGQQFAMTEMSYLIVRFVQTFKGLVSRDEGPWVEKLGTTLSSFNGIKVALTT